MKKIFLILFIIYAFPAQAIEPREEHSININGIGEVEVAVDNVSISAGVSTRDKSIAKAKEDNQTKYASLLKVLEKNGIPKTSIKGNSTYINPVYITCYPTPQNPEPKCDTTKVNYYDVNRNIEIKLEDLTKYDALIGGLSEAGATNVNTGQYGVASITKYRDQARDLAIDAARGKAEKIAKKLGVALGKPIRFDSYDGTAESPIPPMRSRGVMAKMDMAESAPSTDTQTLGKIKVTVNVSIAYGIE